MANVLLSLIGNRDDARAVVDAQAAQLEEFDKKSYTAELRIAADKAKAEVLELKSELDTLPKEQTIRLRVSAETAKLAALETRLKTLNSLSSGGLTDEQGARVAQRMGQVAQQIDATRTRVEGLEHDLDSLGEDGERSFSRISNSLGKVRTGLADVAGHVPLLGGLMKAAINGISNGLQRVVSELPEAVQGIGGVVAAGLGLAAVGPIVFVIAGAFAALVVSLGEALIGVAALGVAFIAALAPIALIVGAAVLKLKDAYQAQQALTAATAAQRQAVDALRQAQQAESTQRLAALAAEKSSVLELRQANDSLRDSKTAQVSAAQQLKAALLARSQFMQQLAGEGMSPGDLTAGSQNVSVGGNFGQTQQGSSSSAMQTLLLQWQQVNLAVREAKDNVKDTATATVVASNAAGSAAANVHKFQSEGLRAFAPYAASILATSKALDAVHTSTAAVNKDSAKMRASDGILGVFDKLKSTLGTLLGGATTAALKGLGTAFGILGKGLKPLEGPLTTLGKAIGAGFVQLAKALTSKTALADFKQLITGAAKLIPSLVSFAAGVGGVLFAVANAAMPALTSGLGKLGGKFIEVAKHPEKIKEFIDKCLTQTKAWIGVIGKLASAFTTLADVMKPVAALFNSISTAVSNIAAISKANQAAQAMGSADLKANAALIARDQAALKSGKLNGQTLTALQRHNLETAISALRSQRPNIKANLPGGSENKQSSGFYNILRQFLPLHAAGGLAMGPSAGIIGDGGPEAILPLRGAVLQDVGRVIAESVTASLWRRYPAPRPSFAGVGGGAASGGVHIEKLVQNMPIHDVGDHDTFARKMAKNLSKLGAGVH